MFGVSASTIVGLSVWGLALEMSLGLRVHRVTERWGLGFEEFGVLGFSV